MFIIFALHFDAFVSESVAKYDSYILPFMSQVFIDFLLAALGESVYVMEIIKTLFHIGFSSYTYVIALYILSRQKTAVDSKYNSVFKMLQNVYKQDSRNVQQCLHIQTCLHELSSLIET